MQVFFVKKRYLIMIKMNIPWICNGIPSKVFVVIVGSPLYTLLQKRIVIYKGNTCRFHWWIQDSSVKAGLILFERGSFLKRK